MLRVTDTNPGRKTGWEEVEQLPNRSWIRRFAERHNLVLRFGMVRKINLKIYFRACSEISKGRQVIHPEDLAHCSRTSGIFYQVNQTLGSTLGPGLSLESG